MRGFGASEQMQRLPTLHGLTQSLFCFSRYLMQAVSYRALPTQAFQVWQDMVYALVEGHVSS